MFVTSALSAVINNTPVVALFIPVAQEWSSRFGYSISKLLLPMNHMVILAGMCTLIGTSTNLIVNSLLLKAVPDSGLSLFSLIWIGLPLTVIGFVYMLIASRGCCRTARARSSSSKMRGSTALRRALRPTARW